MSDAARHEMYAVKEVTYGVTPATPTMARVRITGTSLGLTKETFMSEELRPDRQISDYRHGNKQVGGNLKFELSYGSFDEYLEAMLCGTWTDNVLKAGVTRRSFSILRHFTDQDAGDEPYHIFKGQEFNTLKMNLTPGKSIKCELSVIGQGYAIGAAAPAGSTLEDPTTTRIFDTFTGSLVEGGTTLAIVTELTLNLENGLQPRFALFSDETKRPSIGRSNASGNVGLFFENSTMLKKFLSEEHSSLVFTITDPDGNSYTFNLPDIVYNGGQPDTEGEGSITLTMPYQAIYDEASTSQIVITRTPD